MTKFRAVKLIGESLYRTHDDIWRIERRTWFGWKTEVYPFYSPNDDESFVKLFLMKMNNRKDTIIYE